jgi:hypothetical protein
VRVLARVNFLGRPYVAGDLEGLRKRKRELETEVTYFLLAAAGAGIALAVNQTRDMGLARPQVPVGAAVVCWALSFFFGCRHLRYVSSNLFANFQLLNLQAGEHPSFGSNPEMIAAASEGIRNAITGNDERSGRFARWQFTLIVLGAILYVVWHVCEMYLRNLPQSVPAIFL